MSFKGRMIPMCKSLLSLVEKGTFVPGFLLDVLRAEGSMQLNVLFDSNDVHGTLDRNEIQRVGYGVPIYIGVFLQSLCKCGGWGDDEVKWFYSVLAAKT